jgi:uncharacterized membrane protein
VAEEVSKEAKAKEREVKGKEREVWAALRQVEDEAAALLGVISFLFFFLFLPFFPSSFLCRILLASFVGFFCSFVFLCGILLRFSFPITLALSKLIGQSQRDRDVSSLLLCKSSSSY